MYAARQAPGTRPRNNSRVTRPMTQLHMQRELNHRGGVIGAADSGRIYGPPTRGTVGATAGNGPGDPLTG